MGLGEMIGFDLTIAIGYGENIERKQVSKFQSFKVSKFQRFKVSRFLVSNLFANAPPGPLLCLVRERAVCVCGFRVVKDPVSRVVCWSLVVPASRRPGREVDLMLQLPSLAPNTKPPADFESVEGLATLGG